MYRLPRAAIVAALICGCLAAPAIRASAFAGSPFHPIDPSMNSITVPLAPTQVLAVSGRRLEVDGLQVARDSVQVSHNRRTISMHRTGVAEFGLAAVTWRGSISAKVGVRIRVHDVDGWTPWHQLAAREEVADASSPESAAARSRQGTEPLLTSGHADGVQVRVLTRVGADIRDMKLMLIDGRASAADALAVAPHSFTADGQNTSSAAGALARPVTALSGLTQPRIIPRSGWGADESWRSAPASYSDTIKMAFVHHTVTASDYTQEQAPAQVRAVYAYDTKGLDISDMGYNYVVDRFGNIYEGRAGGIDQPVIGAHTAGFNVGTFAVAVLGDFQHTKLPAAAAAPIVSAISSVTGWKLGLFHVDPDAPVDLISDGLYGTSKYAVGEVAHMPHSLVGHGDIGRTQCPGVYLHAYLNEIRRKARAAQGAILWQPTTTAQQWSYKSAPAVGTAPAGIGVTVAVRASVATAYRVQVLSPCTEVPYAVIDGSAAANSPTTATWNGLSPSGLAALPGDYTIVVSARGPSAEVMEPTSTQVRVAPTDVSPRGPCARVYQFGTDDPIATDVAASHESAPIGSVAMIYSSDKAETAAGLIAVESQAAEKVNTGWLMAVGGATISGKLAIPSPTTYSFITSPTLTAISGNYNFSFATTAGAQ
ncbi:MAG: hypothetical protein EBS41_03090, partial [Actinobacteria bacterium]|nr:hypothetical protein [Actinomycetota bacterium]